MAGSVNKVILVGNLGADPEIRRLNSGDMVVNFRIATSESWKDKNTGERKEKTEWHSIVVFNENLAKLAEQYLKKGMKVYVEGQLSTRKWQGQDGSDRYTTEVVLQKFRGEIQMLDKQQSNRAPGAESPDDYGSVKGGADGARSGGSRTSGQSNGQQSPGVRDLDDDIPF